MKLHEFIQLEYCIEYCNEKCNGNRVCYENCI